MAKLCARGSRRSRKMAKILIRVIMHTKWLLGRRRRGICGVVIWIWIWNRCSIGRLRVLIELNNVVAVGLQNLTSGEKNPISDYNNALKRLQMRRKMTPVTLTMLQGRSAGPIPPTPPVQLPLSAFTALDSETPPILPTTEGDEDTEEQVSEVEQILQDLANGVVDETLPKLTEEDVAFDMDEVVVEEEEIVDEDDDTDEDENDIGWINEEERE
jgi:hypothetical protein